jgi:hypothetical protein
VTYLEYRLDNPYCGDRAPGQTYCHRTTTGAPRPPTGTRATTPSESREAGVSLKTGDLGVATDFDEDGTDLYVANAMNHLFRTWAADLRRRLVLGPGFDENGRRRA